MIDERDMLILEILREDARTPLIEIVEKIGGLEGVQRVCPAVIMEKLKDG